MLTVTVNQKTTFHSPTIAHAKRRASQIANRYAKNSDWMRIYVSSGSLTIDGKVFQQGSELRLKRINAMYPTFKAGEWAM